MTFSQICAMFRRGITIVAGAVLVVAIAPTNGFFAIVIFVVTLIIALWPYKGCKVLPW